MPEGHSIHRLAGELNARFAGTLVEVTSPQGRFAAGAALVSGTTMESAEAHGKHLFIGFAQQRWIHVHLGLYGAVTFVDGAPGAVRGAVRMRICGTTGYADLRGPTRCEVIGVAEKAAVHARLGPDPIRADDPSAALDRLGRSRTPIGIALMDQAIIAGVGNVYRAEVLFRAGIDPATPSRELDRAILEALWGDLVGLMAAGVRSGRIDTVRTEHEPDAMGRPPRVDDHGGEVYVYRRSGQPCHVCGSEIRTRSVAGRNLFWCPECQGGASTRNRLMPDS